MPCSEKKPEIFIGDEFTGITNISVVCCYIHNCYIHSTALLKTLYFNKVTRNKDVSFFLFKSPILWIQGCFEDL